MTMRDQWDALTGAGGMIDVIATDYGPSGRHDALVAGIADVVSRERVPLPVAIAMCTLRVASAIPGLAPRRGSLAAGLIADVVVARSTDITDVRDVYVRGERVVENAELVTAPSTRKWQSRT